MLPPSRHQEALTFCKDMANSWIISEHERKFFSEKLIEEARYKHDMYIFLMQEIRKVVAFENDKAMNAHMTKPKLKNLSSSGAASG